MSWEPPKALTFTYKSVGEPPVELKLDVHLPEATSRAGSPVLLYWHGGGVCSGNRTYGPMLPGWLFKDCISNGITCITADYSLLTPAKGADIVEDVVDCVKWIRDRLNEGLAALDLSQRVNPEALFVSGSSGGGWVAYATALYSPIKVKGFVPIYAMGGLFTHDQYCLRKTASFYWSRDLQSPAKYEPIIAATSRTVSSGWEWPKVLRRGYYSFLLQEATFLDALTGIPGFTTHLARLPLGERFAAIPKDQRFLFPHLAATASFPPTFFVHGDKDHVVPIQESRHMATVLRELGVETRMVEIVGGDHGCDQGDSSAELGLDGVVPFLLEQLESPKAVAMIVAQETSALEAKLDQMQRDFAALKRICEGYGARIGQLEEGAREGKGWEKQPVQATTPGTPASPGTDYLAPYEAQAREAFSTFWAYCGPLAPALSYDLDTFDKVKALVVWNAFMAKVAPQGHVLGLATELGLLKTIETLLSALALPGADASALFQQYMPSVRVWLMLYSHDIAQVFIISGLMTGNRPLVSLSSNIFPRALLRFGLLGPIDVRLIAQYELNTVMGVIQDTVFKGLSSDPEQVVHIVEYAEQHLIEWKNTWLAWSRAQEEAIGSYMHLSFSLQLTGLRFFIHRMCLGGIKSLEDILPGHRPLLKPAIANIISLHDTAFRQQSLRLTYTTAYTLAILTRSTVWLVNLMKVQPHLFDDLAGTKAGVRNLVQLMSNAPGKHHLEISDALDKLETPMETGETAAPELVL
ncbi:hydrolase [Pseudohyphozyma bogoriensis]|nr:hydrolase [Pseudohyphozyma bogoriensis]